MPIGSKDLTVDAIDKIENSVLAEELKKAREELFNLRFQSATGQLESHGRLRAVKRDISRIYTIIRERELGIRAVPVATAAKPAVKAEAKAAEVKAEKPAAKPAAKTTAAAKPAAKTTAAAKPAAKTTKAAKPAAGKES
jgi:large subunit ribosomal protein L29